MSINVVRENWLFWDRSHLGSMCADSIPEFGTKSAHSIRIFLQISFSRWNWFFKMCRIKEGNVLTTHFIFCVAILSRFKTCSMQSHGLHKHGIILWGLFFSSGLQRFNEVMSAFYEDMSNKETMLAIRLSDINHAHEQLRFIDYITFRYGDSNFRNIIFDLSSQEAYELIMKQVTLFICVHGHLHVSPV